MIIKLILLVWKIVGFDLCEGKRMAIESGPTMVQSILHDGCHLWNGDKQVFARMYHTLFVSPRNDLLSWTGGHLKKIKSLLGDTSPLWRNHHLANARPTWGRRKSDGMVDIYQVPSCIPMRQRMGAKTGKLSHLLTDWMLWNQHHLLNLMGRQAWVFIFIQITTRWQRALVNFTVPKEMMEKNCLGLGDRMIEVTHAMNTHTTLQDTSCPLPRNRRGVHVYSTDSLDILGVTRMKVTYTYVYRSDGWDMNSWAHTCRIKIIYIRRERYACGSAETKWWNKIRATYRCQSREHDYDIK